MYGNEKQVLQNVLIRFPIPVDETQDNYKRDLHHDKVSVFHLN